MQKLFTKEFRPGEKWSGLIGKNKYIHFKALGDNANVSILLYNMQRHVFKNGFVGEQVERLEYHANFGPEVRELLAFLWQGLDRKSVV